jgi:hypothetical protein
MPIIPGGENGPDFAYQVSMNLAFEDIAGNRAWGVGMGAIKPGALKLHCSQVRIECYRGLQQRHMMQRIGQMMCETKPQGAPARPAQDAESASRKSHRAVE